MDTTWHAVQTASQQEFEVAQRLIRKGYRAWYPYCWQTVRHARYTTDKRRPVFVRYIFLGLREGQGYLEPASMRGVTSIVSFGEEPVKIPARMMRSLMDRCDADGYMRSADDLERLPEYEVGQRVRLKGGGLDGLISQIAAIDERGMLEVELELLGGRRRAAVPPSRVEADVSP